MCLKLMLARKDAATQKLHYNSKFRIGCPCGAYSVPTVRYQHQGIGVKALISRHQYKGIGIKASV